MGTAHVLIKFKLWICCVSLAANVQDRFVVREGKPSELLCIHNSESIERVKWNFQPLNSGAIQTIYDTRDNKFNDTKYHILCQDWQSQCNIKLLKTRKEDSGKYICSIEKIDTNHPIAFIEFELVIRGPKKESMIVNIGEMITLSCHHNISNVARVKWAHLSIDNRTNEYSYQMSPHKTSQANFEVLCNPYELYCNLTIFPVDKESAGRYTCMHGDSSEYEEKYGFSEMTDFVEIELNIGEITCNTNGKDDITLIGENDCHGINPDVLSMECSFNYYGNIDVDGRNLKWIGHHELHSQDRTMNLQNVQQDLKTISIQRNLTAVNSINDKTIQCILENTKVKPCHLIKYKIHYAKNATEKPQSMYSDDLHSIKCQADKSESVQCSYYWMHNIAGATLKTPHSLLPAENMNSPGIYTCIAKCSIKEHMKECNIKAMEIEVIYVGSPSVAGFIITIIALLITIALMGYILYRVYLRKNYKNILPCYKVPDSEIKDSGKIEVNESSKMLGKDGDNNEEGENIEPKIPEFKFTINRPLGRLMKGFAMNGNTVVVCSLDKSEVDVYTLDQNKNNMTPNLKLKDVMGIETISSRLYILGLKEKLGTGKCVKIYKVNNLSGSRNMNKIYVRPYDKNDLIMLTKSHCGNNLLLISRDELRFLSTDGDELKKIELRFLISNAYHLSEGRFIISSLKDKSICIVGDSGDVIAKYSSTESMPDIDSTLITSISSDAFGNVYLNNKGTIFVLNNSLQFLGSHDIGKDIQKFCFDNEKLNFFVLAGSNLLEFKMYEFTA